MRFVAVALVILAVACLEGCAHREFYVMVQKEGMKSHEPILNPDQPDPVEEFVGRNPGGAYGVCADALKKNLRPAVDQAYRTADLALRCVAASGDTRALAFLEWVAFQSMADSHVAFQSVYFIGRLAPEKEFWAVVKRLEMEPYPGPRSGLSRALVAIQDPRGAEHLDAAAKRETDESVRRQMIREAYLLRHQDQCVFNHRERQANDEMPLCVYECVGGTRTERSTTGACTEFIPWRPMDGVNGQTP
jgi:hypothetical protein